ncbi:ABC transporter substrate-binding protein [Bradyrhizobium sp. NP1]|uniref:ABC transporter substrate-binding protein n=1 Tax=Bradyrhizobium sp. NP1 TaxID=3049772 RepID=UPI0025A5BF32|nr:ABC transporter substrate-binding protein [Bradyrhizobium sp. NP1]WJR77874.1 ABC transporter substrate-binding protein [Bradyrhizobium sp. NP1]
MDRRRVVAGIGAALLSAGARPAIALAQGGGKPLRITHAVTSLAYMQSYVAQQNGYFEQTGFAAQIIDTGGGGPDVQLVLGGRADLTVNDGAQIFPALQQGQKLVCVLALLDRSIINATISKAAAQRVGFTETTPFDQRLKLLKGMKIGVTRAGALTWQQARFNLAAAGLDPDRDAQVVAIGGPPALAAALENGAIDVMYISMPIGEKLVKEGKALSFVDNARGEDPKLPTFLMEGLWTTTDFLAANRPTVEAAVGAYKKASKFIRESSPDKVVAALKPTLGSLGDAVLLDSVQRIQSAVSETGKVTAQQLETTQAVLKLNGFLQRTFTLAEVFDGSLIGA